jgi:hypothetical protein
MGASCFFDPHDSGILFMVYHKVKQGERLVKSNLTFGRFTADSIDDITLQSKKFCKNGYDDGSLTVFGEAENNTSGLVKHNTRFWPLDFFCCWNALFTPETRIRNQ